MTTLHDFGGDSGRPLASSFWASRFHGLRSWLVCEVALNTLTPLESLSLQVGLSRVLLQHCVEDWHELN